MAIINYIPNVKTPTGFDTLNTVSQFTNHVATGVFTNVDTYEINVPAPNDILTGQFVLIFVPDTDSIVGMKISINNGTAIPIDGVGVGSLQAGVATSLLVDIGAGVAYQYFKDVDLTANNLPLTTGTAELYGVENVDDALKLALLPTGSVINFCDAVPPTGFLECNGATVSRTTYAKLFNKIGTTYGAGNGTTTFTLPDLRGEFIRGWDNGRGIDTGRIIGTSQSATTVVTSAGQSGYASTNVDNNRSVTNKLSSGYTSPQSQTYNIGDVRPRNVAMMYCIKY